MARLVWTREAVADLEAIRIYVRQFDPQASQRLARRLIDTAESLRHFPAKGREAGGGFRQLSLVRPYFIRYRLEGDAIYITGIRHGARRPDTDQD